MSKSITERIVSVFNYLKDNSLDNPYIFNNVRRVITGNQKQTKLFVKKFLKSYKCKTVIDVCSGTGDFASSVDKHIDYLGVDINEDYVNYSKNKYKKDKSKIFRIGNMLDRSQFNGKKFDAAMLISTIHHFSDHELNILLPILKKITRKIVIVADIIPNPPHAIERMFVRLDRGKYIRPEKEKIKILKRHFKIIKTMRIPSRFSIQYGVICQV